MATTLLIAVAGVIGGVALAFVLSPFAPLGEARLADPSPGLAFDPYILLPGALAAIIVVLALGIGVNVTLLFADSHYLRTADAYMRALERRRGAGLDLAVPSVASVFISRWDSAADPLLPPALQGGLGLAMAQKTYASHLQLLADKRWQALAEAGARPQRVLWASTSTKNPDLPDTYYLGCLAAPDTIDTVPEKTLLAFADHGSLDHRLQPDHAAAERTIAAIAQAGLDVDALAERLQRQGAGAFSADWSALLAAIQEKAATVKITGNQPDPQAEGM
jgi:transaldolase